jgi:sigma-B regulation protein RsbU (phosphoserine phosphatase)
MLKGIAHAGGGDLPEDRHGIVVALSHLTQNLADTETDSAFDLAAETAAALLHVQRVVVFIREEAGELTPSGGVGVRGDQATVDAAGQVAAAGLSSNTPFIIANTSADSSGYARALSKAGVASVMCVPMRVSDTNVGVIVVMSNDLRAFSPSDIELLHVVASHAALAAWRPDPDEPPADARKHDDLIRLADRKIQELSLLNQISEEMSSTLDLTALLDIALEQSLAAVGAGAGSIMLVSEETGRLEIAASRGLDRKLVENTSQEIGQSIAGWVAEHGESVLVTDAHRDARFNMPFYRDNITSSASVPLKTKGAVIGVLNVNTVRADRAFDERDLELLATVANQMAVAIENARLYARVNRRTKQLSSLLQISKTVTSTLNLDEILHRLTGEICALFGLDVCAVLLVDELSNRLRFGHGAGLKTRRKSAYHDLAAPLATRVKDNGRKIVLRDVSTSSALYSEVAASEGLKSAVAIPLRNQGKVVAVAVGFARQPRVFPRSQRDIMLPLGDLAGVAIHNARVYRRKYRIAEMLQQKLLPSELPRISGLDIGCKFLPAREVGGDYYDFINMGERKLGLVMSDVSGSDVEAAEYTTMAKHILRVYARECTSPADVLARTNDLVCEDTTAEVFVSTFYGVVDLDRGILRYANAGCEPAVLYKARTGEVTQLLADGILLGIRGGVVFEEREVSLESGDVLAIYTDGVTEACVGSCRFGAEAAMRSLAANSQYGAQEIADRLHDTLLEFVHGQITDDVAMVVVKVL